MGKSHGVENSTLGHHRWRRGEVRGKSTASSAEGEQALRAIGIEQTFDPRADDVVSRLKRLAPQGLTAVLALAGGEKLERCIDLTQSRLKVVIDSTYKLEDAARAHERLERPLTRNFLAAFRDPVASSLDMSDWLPLRRRLARSQVFRLRS